MPSLNSNLQEIAGVGEKTSKLLKKLGLNTVLDLIFYFPFRYEQYKESESLKDLESGENIRVEGELLLIKTRRGKRRGLWITEAILSRGDEDLKVIWFNQPYISKTLKPGDKLILKGKIGASYGQPTMMSPEYERVNTFKYELKKTDSTNDDDKTFHPVYHLTEGSLSQKQLRNIIEKVINLSSSIKEWLPLEINSGLKLIPLNEALIKIHFPKNEVDILKSKERLAFSNLFLRQLKSQSIKHSLKKRNAPPIKFKEKETRDFVNSLPFKLTNDQKKTAWEILKDLEKDKAMSRLLEGDVGSGKTLVVTIAMLNTALNKKKAALMVPSEILASQHFKTISKLLASYPIEIALKTRSYKINDYKTADIIIGTQSLIQEKAMIKNLGLVVVDEQHRFGVNQRKRIIDLNKEKGELPHFLSLSATPIPRSLSLALYGDLDLSLINELPVGRKKTITKVLKEEERNSCYDLIKEKLKAGQQAFFVYPLISSSDKISFKSVKDDYDRIANDIFKDFKVELIHGKIKKEEKEKIMSDFSDKKIDILMATTVIEVGIDVPNATLIVIEGADRFGLSQLHQLRGRVNRSDQESFCFLFPSKDDLKNEKTIERLKALENHHKGIDLAKIDLDLRGSGEVFGSLQSGFLDLSALSLFSLETIKKSRDFAQKIIESDEYLEKYPIIKEKLKNLDKDFHLE